MRCKQILLLCQRRAGSAAFSSTLCRHRYRSVSGNEEHERACKRTGEKADHMIKRIHCRPARISPCLSFIMILSIALMIRVTKHARRRHGRRQEREEEGKKAHPRPRRKCVIVGAAVCSADDSDRLGIKFRNCFKFTVRRPDLLGDRLFPSFSTHRIP